MERHKGPSEKEEEEEEVQKKSLYLVKLFPRGKEEEEEVKSFDRSFHHKWDFTCFVVSCEKNVACSSDA